MSFTWTPLGKQNNAGSTLNGSITSGATTMIIQTGDHTKFPSVKMNVTIFPAAGIPGQGEIVAATYVSGDTYSIVRAQEGTSAQSWSSGANVQLEVTAAQLVEHENHILNHIHDGTDSTAIPISSLAPVAWTTYAPVWASSGTAPSIGNGTLIGAYTQIGKTTHCTLTFAAGSTTSFGTGTYTFSLPVTAATVAGQNFIGALRVYESSVNTNYTGDCRVNSAATVLTMQINNTVGDVGATVPMTFSTGDAMQLSVTYPAA